MTNTQKTFAAILGILAVALIVVGFSVKAFPQWLTLPGGVLLLIVAAFVGVADLGNKIKGFRDMLFGDGKEAGGRPEQTQIMRRSEGGEQAMRGRGGKQAQTMVDSPGGKQKMD